MVAPAFSISSAERAHECPPGLALPGASAAGERAGIGTAVHRGIRLFQDGADPAEIVALPEVGPARAILARLEWHRLPRGEPEVPLAFDAIARTVRRLPPGNGDRDYAMCAATEIAGTTDLGCLAADEASVEDWKLVTYESDLDAYRHALEAYGLCWSRLHRTAGVRCRIWSITDAGEVSCWADWSLDALDLAAVEARLVRAWHAVQEARAARAEHEARARAPWTPSVSEGTWCKWCPARLVSCPAKLAVVRAVAAGGALPATQLGALYVQAKLLEDAAEAAKNLVRDELHARLADGAQTELPTGDGRVVRLDSRQRLSLKRLRMSS